MGVKTSSTYFKISQERFHQAIKEVSGALPTRVVQPILQSIYIQPEEDRVILRATDLDLWIESYAPASIKSTNAIVVPGKKLFEIVSKLPSDEDVIIEGNEDMEVTIKCGRSQYNLYSSEATDYPSSGWENFKDSVKLSGQDLRKAFNLTTFAAASYDLSSILGGVFVVLDKGTLECTATDGSRMACWESKVKGSAELSALIPVKSAIEINKLLNGTDTEDIELSIENKTLLVSNDRFKLSTRLLSGEYPKYKEIFPSDAKVTIEVNCENLKRSMDRASILTDTRTHLVRMEFDDKELHIRANTPDLGKVHEIVEIEMNGEKIEVALNNRYLMDVLTRIDTEHVKVELTGELKPIVVRASDNYKYLVMPVQAK